MRKALAEGLLGWFERHGRTPGHRAFFAAAPRYAALAAGITAIPFLIYWWSGHWWALFFVTLVGVAAMFTLVYVFFFIVGTLAQSNEEKARRLSEANGELSRYAHRVSDDLNRARQVQQRMLPDMADMPLPDRLIWASRFIPEDEVGGDYFDVGLIGSRKVAIIFGDVSGHGMAAAFITAILKTSFRAWLDDPDELTSFVTRLNSHLYRLTPDDSFAAVFMATYDSDTGVLQYVSGGHHPEPWIVPADEDIQAEMLSDARSMLLGVEETLDVHQARRQLGPGDRVILATDGLVEAQDTQRRMFTVDRLSHLVEENRHRPLAELVELIVSEVAAFSAGGPVHDDRTILAFEVKRLT